MVRSGLSAEMAAEIQGCAAIIVIEPHAARRDLAVEFGATHVLDPADHPDLTASLRGMLGLVSVAKPVISFRPKSTSL